MLAAVVQHGTEAVAEALNKALEGGQHHLLALAALSRQPMPQTIRVPEPLSQYIVEAACAADFDALLGEVPS